MIYANTDKDIIVTLTANIFPIPQRIQGFGEDAIFTVDEVEDIDIVKGADGYMSAAKQAVVYTGTLTLAAGSPSIPDVIDIILQGQKNTNLVIPCTLTFKLPSLNTTYVLSEVIFKSAFNIGSSAKKLAERTFTIAYSDINKY